jgi:putative transposase
LAPNAFSIVLEIGFKSQETPGEEADVSAGPEFDLPHGRRKPDLGHTAHPRGTPHAWFRCFRENSFALDEASSKGSCPAKRWLAFLRNHREARAAMDFFTVPTLTFRVLHGFFVISHDRRRILHFNVTRHPTSHWIVQQLREAFPFGSAPRFLIFDRDAKYGLEVSTAVRSLKMESVRASFASPWQNGVAERWIEGCRRDLLDHVIALNERHLKCLPFEYVRYYHEDRTHLGLGKGTPQCRSRTMTSGRAVSHERVGGLHHRYDRAA